MKIERYTVEIEMPDDDWTSSTWVCDTLQSESDIEDEGRWKVSVKEYWKPNDEQKNDIHNKLTDFEFSLKHIMEEAIECGDTHNLKADADMLLRLAQNSTWSEEDERIYNSIMYSFAHNYPLTIQQQEFIKSHRLKSK